MVFVVVVVVFFRRSGRAPRRVAPLLAARLLLRGSADCALQNRRTSKEMSIVIKNSTVCSSSAPITISSPNEMLNRDELREMFSLVCRRGLHISCSLLVREWRRRLWPNSKKGTREERRPREMVLRKNGLVCVIAHGAAPDAGSQRSESTFGCATEALRTAAGNARFVA